MANYLLCYQVCDVIAGLFVSIFRHLNENCKEELGVINKQRPFEPLKVKQPCLFILWYYSTNCRLNLERSWFFRKPLVAGPQVSLTAGWARGANGGMSFEGGGPTQWRVQNIGTGGAGQQVRGRADVRWG